MFQSIAHLHRLSPAEIGPPVVIRIAIIEEVRP
jgi:hypothetical protein